MDFGDNDALGAVQAPGLANLIKALDLPVDSADGLGFAPLAHRTGHGDILGQGEFGQGGHQGAEFRQGGAVAFHHAVALLEAEAGRQGQGLVLGKAALQVSPPG